MYNGIGLQTPRGSGTNGYVQKNLAFITNTKEKIPYKTDYELDMKSSIFREPNKDILLHEKKRKIEVKCYELSKNMQEQGYADAEIQEKVSEYRRILLEELVTKPQVAGTKESLFHEDGERIIPKGSHETSELSKIKNDVFKQALGISKDFQDGTSMEVAHQRRIEAELAKKLREEQEKLTLLKSSDDGSSSDSDVRGHKKKSKHGKKSKKRSRSEAKERHNGSSKKHKKRARSSSDSCSDSESDTKSSKQAAKHKKQKEKKKKLSGHRHRHRNDETKSRSHRKTGLDPTGKESGA